MNQTSPDLSILIVGYNSRAYLGECLSSIPDAIREHSFETLFVNNGTDTSEAFITAAYPMVSVLPSQGNVGFAAGNNYLAEHANGRWLLLLNPDTRLMPGALDRLLAAAREHPYYDVLGGITVTEDGQVETMAQLELPSLTRLARAFIRHRTPPTSALPDRSVREVEALTGGFMMVSRECWLRLGGLDQGFFLYAEELDFFKRLKAIGGREAQVSESRVFHDFGSGDVFSPNRIRFLVTGNAHYFHKHFSKPYAYACVFLQWATIMKRFVGGRLLAGRSARYARMTKGFAPVARAPWTWMRGYESPGADPRKPR